MRIHLGTMGLIIISRGLLCSADISVPGYPSIADPDDLGQRSAVILFLQEHKIAYRPGESDEDLQSHYCSYWDGQRQQAAATQAESSPTEPPPVVSIRKADPDPVPEAKSDEDIDRETLSLVLQQQYHYTDIQGKSVEELRQTIDDFKRPQEKKKIPERVAVKPAPNQSTTTTVKGLDYPVSSGQEISFQFPQFVPDINHTDEYKVVDLTTSQTWTPNWGITQTFESNHGLSGTGDFAGLRASKIACDRVFLNITNTGNAHTFSVQCIGDHTAFNVSKRDGTVQWRQPEGSALSEICRFSFIGNNVHVVSGDTIAPLSGPIASRSPANDMSAYAPQPSLQPQQPETVIILVPIMPRMHEYSPWGMHRWQQQQPSWQQQPPMFQNPNPPMVEPYQGQ